MLAAQGVGSRRIALGQARQHAASWFLGSGSRAHPFHDGHIRNGTPLPRTRLRWAVRGSTRGPGPRPGVRLRLLRRATVRVSAVGVRRAWASVVAGVGHCPGVCGGGAPRLGVCGCGGGPLSGCPRRR
ncbi:hypothetical protein Stsp02_30000 [Streptomyces sp. NBRC 14336]|nr:hypothetical protein Stsp02_30000 [Streptomyces sp. NBRC 14336]